MAKQEPLITDFELTTSYHKDGWRMTTSLDTWRVKITPSVKSLVGAVGVSLPEALRNLADEIERRDFRYRIPR